MHKLIEVENIISSKQVSHFKVFNKSDIPNFSFHFLCNKKGLELIECHVQGTIRHWMKNKKEQKSLGGWANLKNDNECKHNL